MKTSYDLVSSCAHGSSCAWTPNAIAETTPLQVVMYNIRKYTQVYMERVRRAPQLVCVQLARPAMVRTISESQLSLNL